MTQSSTLAIGHVETNVIEPSDLLLVVAQDDRVLLRIAPDGSVTGDIEDMGEAARIFVTHVRHLAIDMGLRLAP